jgi:hypothetical protein
VAAFEVWVTTASLSLASVVGGWILFTVWASWFIFLSGGTVVAI